MASNQAAAARRLREQKRQRKRRAKLAARMERRQENAANATAPVDDPMQDPMVDWGEAVREVKLDPDDPEAPALPETEES